MEDLESTGDNRDRKKVEIYDMWDLSSILIYQQENIMPEKFTYISHNEDFESDTFREMVRSFEVCEKMLRWETESPVEKNEFLREIK